jgi:hypothetical protein
MIPFLSDVVLRPEGIYRRSPVRFGGDVISTHADREEA